MEWWEQLNNFAAMIPQSPALAVHFATSGPNPDTMGYDLVAALQNTPTSVDLYPSATPGG